MSLLKKIVTGAIVLGAASVALLIFWARQPITDPAQQAIEFAIKAGSGVRSSAQQIVGAGVPVNPTLLTLLARLTGNGGKIKPGTYELNPGTTPYQLLDQVVRGDSAQESLAIIEGWTFKQMRQEIARNPALKHDTLELSDQALLAKITSDYATPEGLFFPDTYLFAQGTSDLQIYRQAHALLKKRLADGWSNRSASLPYKNPYEVLIMASIIEKETGQSSERDRVAAVFVNRLKRGMPLQTDPSVIYGMGDQYQGNIHKRDLLADTPYNTYTRAGLPPTPIALPSAASLAAALNPAAIDALYFVARGDGTSEFSTNLADHNRAVNKYQR